MLTEQISAFIKQHHVLESKEHEVSFDAIIQKLCEAMQAGSSCLDLDTHEEDLTPILRINEINSAISSAIGRAPLICEGNKLYFERYFHYEQEVFQKLNFLSNIEKSQISSSTQKLLEALFESTEDNQQAQAAICALKSSLTIITGGPGTGKTTTVLQILRLLAHQKTFTNKDEVSIIAPTGKAADRLRQSIQSGIKRLGLDNTEFPTETSTIHRALGYKPKSIHFKHNKKTPIKAKVIIVDESSMVDLPLMAKLLQAIPNDAKLILLGDQYQLSSVEVGSVLADLIDVATLSSHPISNCTITLEKSYRTTGAIQQACKTIKQGDVNETLEIVKDSDLAQAGAVRLSPIPKHLLQELSLFVSLHWLPILQSDLSPAEKLSKIDAFRILCPTRSGPYGVTTINKAIDYILSANGIDTTDSWYDGRSIIIQKNDIELGVFNGDTGICSAIESVPFVHFAEQQHPPALLPEVESAWALTIHRTQGSEYDHILVILPPTTTEHKFMTRELLYTALSRAKISANIWADEIELTEAIHSQVQRASGLADKFQE